MAHQVQVQELSKFKSVVLKISRGGVMISCVMLAVMLFISTADVLGRYFFNAPIDGTWEIVSMCFVICGAFAIGYTQFIKGHISIGILADRLKPRIRAGISIFGYLICLTSSSLVAWKTWDRMIVYFHKTLGGETVTLGMPIWPFMLALALGFFWVAIIFVIDIYDSVREVIKR